MKNTKIAEEERKLSKAEEIRLARFEEKKSVLESEGYKSCELTIGIIKANIYAFLMGIPLVAFFLIIFFAVNHDRVSIGIGIMTPLIFLITYIILVVIHELIHGITWAIFSRNHFKDIEFGFMKEYLTPYCCCLEPQSKRNYLLGGLMPLFLLGIIPSIIAIVINSIGVLIMGLVMIIAAGGDIMICAKILQYKTNAKDILYFDHPTKAGLFVFERNEIEGKML